MMRARRLMRDRRGAGTVEFALAAPVFLTFIIGIAQMGILFVADAGLQHAVGEGARLATLTPAPTDAEIQALVADKRFGLDPSRIASTTVTRGTSNGTDFANVAMTYNVPLDFIFFEGPTVTLQESRRSYLP